MAHTDDEEALLRSVALQNARSIQQARQRMEDELVRAKHALEVRSVGHAHSLAMLRATLEATSDGIMVADSERRVTGYNRQYIEMWRLPAGLLDDPGHRHPGEICTRQLKYPQGYLAKLDEIYLSAPPESFDVLEMADGRFFERLSRVQFVDGQIVGRVWSYRDVTERNRADEAQVLLAAIVDSSEDAIVSKSLEGIIRSWNAGAERLFGYTRDEAVGQSITLIIPPDLIEEERQILAQLRRGERIEHFETVRVSKTGRRLDISLSISPIRDRDGRIVGVSKVARDITESKRAQQALLEADRRKDEFLALLAHELRNPMAPLRNGLQVMRLAAGDVQAVAQARAMMDRQLGHLVRLVDDLLDVARIGQNKIELRRARISLTEVIENAVEIARPVIEAGGHELTVSLPNHAVFLDADLTRLVQVLSNLLTNSAKYTEHGGRIEVTAAQRDDAAVISVRDTGIGIPPEELSTVFGMFSQVDRSIERTTGGLGIGLALVKGLVEMHGGSVIAESAGQGMGSTFTVRLPIAGAEGLVQPVTRIDHERPIAAASRRILVADDNQDAARSMARLLTLQGNDVRTAHDGIEAVSIANAFRPQVVLMDVDMPRMNGYEAVRRIREQAWSNGSVIVAVTGWGQDDDRIQSLVAGCDGHLVKPVDLADLQRLLGKLTDAR